MYVSCVEVFSLHTCIHLLKSSFIYGYISINFTSRYIHTDKQIEYAFFRGLQYAPTDITVGYSTFVSFRMTEIYPIFISYNTRLCLHFQYI